MAYLPTCELYYNNRGLQCQAKIGLLLERRNETPLAVILVYPQLQADFNRSLRCSDSVSTCCRKEWSTIDDRQAVFAFEYMSSARQKFPAARIFYRTTYSQIIEA